MFCVCISNKGYAMNAAQTGTTFPQGLGGRLRLWKIFAVLLVIACVETAVYWQLAAPTTEPSGVSAALTPQKALEYMHTTAGLMVIDVRSRKEFADGHLPGAVNMPLYAFPSLAKNIPQGVPVLLHCQYGYRALQAYKLFRRLRPDIVNVRYAAGQLHFSFSEQDAAAE